MSTQASASPTRPLLSTANDVAVQLEHYLHCPRQDHSPDLEIASAADLSSIAYGPKEVVESLCQWIISRMEIRRSSRPNAYTSCSDHHYLVLEVSNELHDCSQLRIDFTSCSGRRSDLLDSEFSCAKDLNYSPCPSTTPAPIMDHDNIFVTPVLFDFSVTDECLRRVSLSASDVDSIYERAVNPESVNDENGDFTLLSLASLIMDSFKDLKLKEMVPIPLCQTVANALTEVVRKSRQPWIENSSSSVCSNHLPHDRLHYPVGSHDRISSDIDAECLLRMRRILDLKLRLAIAELASACTDIKLFNLTNTAFAIGLKVEAD